MQNYSYDEIYKAKQYMQAYESLIDMHDIDIGIIGRFFEKLFGTNKYSQIETMLKEWYSLTYNEAYTILDYTGNKEYIFDPFLKK